MADRPLFYIIGMGRQSKRAGESEDLPVFKRSWDLAEGLRSYNRVKKNRDEPLTHIYASRAFLLEGTNEVKKIDFDCFGIEPRF